MPNKIKYPKNIVIVTHELFYGAAQAFRDYLRNHRIGRLVFIAHPLRKENSYTIIQQFHNGKLYYKKTIRRHIKLAFWQYIGDLWLTLFWIGKQRSSYELFVGVDPLNTLVGLCLRKFHITKKVIFYAIDFTPRRFTNPIVNVFYHMLETFCVKHSDESWNVSPRIAVGRKKYLKIDPLRFPQKVVPIGLWKNEIVRESKKIDYKIGFIGHLLEKQGVQKVLESLVIVRKLFPRVTFLVIGGGEYLPALKTMSRRLHLDPIVTFTGWVNDRQKIRSLLSSCSLAVATYVPSGFNNQNFTYYADPTKLKTYLACGLPIVMTNISYNARSLEKARCAKLVDYDTHHIARGILSYFRDTKELHQAQRRAYLAAEEYLWGNIFTNALAQ